MSRIFINYRRQDSEGYVGRLYDHLIQHFKPDDVFMDVDSIEPGADFVQVLEDAVAACDVLLAVIGPRWSSITDNNGQRRLDQWNDFVRIEIATALKHNKLVIPVLVGQAPMPGPHDLPEDILMLARRNAIDLHQRHFARDVEKLINVIHKIDLAEKGLIKPQDDAVIREKEEAIKALRLKLVGATDSPLYAFRNENRYFPVIGEGHADANIFFIGESPGKREAESGKPFCGPSGDVLDEMLDSIGLRREHVYLSNILLDRTPENRDPTPQELAYYAPFMDRLIEIIQPKVIVTLGRYAMQYLLKKLDLPEKRGTITNLHGKLLKADLPYGEVHIVPLYHPAVVLYTASQKEILRKDFEKLKLFI